MGNCNDNREMEDSFKKEPNQGIKIITAEIKNTFNGINGKLNITEEDL